jgi:hypothetical protein
MAHCLKLAFDAIFLQLFGTTSRSMLSATHGVARMQRVWGPGDGRPVPELKEDVDMLLQEYLLSRDLAEATRFVKINIHTHSVPLKEYLYICIYVYMCTYIYIYI